MVAKLRGILGEKKIGHMGTLDPLATGVLVCAVGRAATKTIAHHMGADKDYEVEMELGKQSDTYDAEGEILENEVDWSQMTDEKILEVIESFWGEQMQMPPAFSAKKVNGRRAYELARAGQEVKLKPKKVSMQGSDIEIDLPFVRFKVTVSSGTYIRSLVHDIGEKLGTGALMTELHRTRVGDFSIDQAASIEEVEAGTYDWIDLPPSE